MSATLVLAGAIGLAVGAIVGALGGGGGILTVPILVYLLRLDPHAAATASLVIVGTTSLVAVVPHARQHHVRWRQGVTFGVLGAVWAYLGARLSVAVAPEVLMAGFAALLVVVAVLMLRRSWLAVRVRRGSREARAAEAAEPSAGGGAGEAGGAAPASSAAGGAGTAGRVLMVVAAASMTGLLTGFFGVGGGFAVVPALVLALRVGMRDAVGTSLLVIVLNSVTGLAGRTSELAAVDWPLVAAFALASMIGGLVGARLSRRASADRLSLTFGVLLAVVAVATAVQAVPDLLALL